ncbi:MAG: glycosyltransferase [Candidatus Portnoybacteria bacterium]|nr:glycosyltransferase [Candidatus Portnoybacteria bacterium]
MSKKKIKIAFFIGTFPSITESWFVEQLTSLLDMGLSIDVFAFEGFGEYHISELMKKYRLLERTTYMSFPENKIKRFFRAIWYFLKVLILKPSALSKIFKYQKYTRGGFPLKYLFWIAPLVGKIEKYDVVHCHFGMIANRFLIIREILGLKQKFLTTFYGQDSSKYIKQKGEHVYDELKKTSSYFLLMTEEMKERFVAMGFPPEKLLVHYTALNIDNYEFNYKPLLAGEKFKLVTVGSFLEKKGLDDSIRAIGEVVSRGYKNIELNIVGGRFPDYEKMLRDLVDELKLNDRVVFRGLLPHSQTIAFFKEMHLMIQLSRRAQNGDTDDLPFVLLEGEICGLPVITTRHVGIPDGVKVGESGFLVEERNWKEAAEKIISLLDNPEKLKDLSFGANRFMKEKFDIKEYNQRLAGLYDELAE